jgi:hypothetical protein
MSGRHLATPEPEPAASRGRHALEVDVSTDDGRTPSYGLREPIRLWIRSVVVAGLAVATAYGLIKDEMVPLWTALVGAALAVPAAEVARAKAWSPASVEALQRGDSPGTTYGGPIGGGN